MKAKSRILDFLYYFIIGMTCTFAIALNSLTATVMGSDILAILKYSFIFMTFFYIWFYNKYTFFTGTGLILIGGIIGIFSYYRKEPEDTAYFKLIETIKEVVDFILGFGEYKDWYGTLLEAFIIFLIAMVVASTIKNWMGFYAITIMGAITIMVPAIYSWDKSNIGRYLFLACFVVLLLEKLNAMMSGSDSGATQVNYLYSLIAFPLAIVFIMGSTLLPTFSIDDVSVLDEINTKGSTILAQATQKKSLLQRNEKKLGGPLVLNDRVVMEVISDAPLYLKGMAMESYTGNMWRSKNQTRERLVANEQSEYEILLENNNTESFYLGKGTVKIIPDEESLTRNIYTVPFAHVLTMEGETPTIYSDDNLSLWKSGELEQGTNYTESYSIWDYNSEAFQLNLRNYGSGASGQVDAKYLELPPTITQRVRDLTSEITENSVSDYAKLRAIESYLRENYPYTLETSELPEGEDFVDYFLFTEKQGYCVYYASAMAIMARIEGIPTRYVEGYVMPPARNADGNYTVTNQQAHAWVEAYFPEFGWVKFEPTSAYLANNVSVPLDETDVEIPERETEDTPVDEPDTDIEEPKADEKDTDNSETDIKDKDNAEIEEIKKPLNKLFIIIPIVILFVALFIVFVKFMIDYKYNKLKQVKKLKPKPQAKEYFKYILRMLKTMGYQPIKSETFAEFIDRIQPEIKTDLYEVSEIFNRVTYSKLEISTEESEVVENTYDELLIELTSGKYNKIKILAERYFLMLY